MRGRSALALVFILLAAFLFPLTTGAGQTRTTTRPTRRARTTRRATAKTTPPVIVAPRLPATETTGGAAAIRAHGSATQSNAGAAPQSGDGVVGVSPQPQQTPAPAPAQTPADTAEDDDDVIRVTSNLVVVPVSVTDEQGEPVVGLKKEDFRLEEEGRAQQLTEVGDADEVPLDIAVLLDVSSSVNEQFDFERQAAARFLKSVLKPKDRAAVFAIDAKPRFVHGLASADEAAGKLLTVTPAKGFTAFFDTVLEATRYLVKSSSPQHRRVILVISDGDDTARILAASMVDNKEAQMKLLRKSVDDVQREVQRADTVFYSINPSGQTMHLNVRTARSQEGMAQLADATGGSSFVPARFEELEGVFRRIAAELRAQYLLQYHSNAEAAPGKFLKIRVSTPARERLRIRARQGYYKK